MEFPFPLQVSASSSDKSGEAGKISKTPVKTSVKTPVKTRVKAPVKTPYIIIQHLAKNPTMTLAEVATEIGKSLRAVERASAKLVKDGKLEYVGPQKGGRWQVLT